MRNLIIDLVSWILSIFGTLIARAWAALRSAFVAVILVALPFGIVWLINLCPHIETNAGQYEGIKTLALLGFGFFMVWRVRALEVFVKAIS